MAKIGYDVDLKKDADGHRGEFTVYPPGWHKVVIVGSEMIDTEKGGKMAVFKLEKQDDGGEQTLRLNLMHKTSEIAQKIGRGALGKIGIAVKLKGKLKDTKQLHGLPFDIKAKIKPFKSNETGEMLDSNEFTDFRKCEKIDKSSSKSEAPASNDDSSEPSGTTGESGKKETPQTGW